MKYGKTHHKKKHNLNSQVEYNAIERYFNVLKSQLQKKKGLTYDELIKNVKDVLDEIPIHIYKNLIKVRMKEVKNM